VHTGYCSAGCDVGGDPRSNTYPIRRAKRRIYSWGEGGSSSVAQFFGTWDTTLTMKENLMVEEAEYYRLGLGDREAFVSLLYYYIPNSSYKRLSLQGKVGNIFIL
jgi:hypothetical protein